MSDRVTFFHAPNTRSGGTLLLLEELGADYDLHLLDMKAGDQRKPEYLAINPMGKVPAIKHGDAVITEQVAVFLYLGDLFPKAGITPRIGDPLRGPYLRWMAFYAGCLEPAMVDKALKREPAPPSMSPYGTYESVISAIVGQLSTGPWLLGERFTVADVLWGTALSWMRQFQLFPEDPAIVAYTDRFNARPLVARCKAQDAEIAAVQDADRVMQPS
jgi:glutathione S-transferase